MKKLKLYLFALLPIVISACGGKKKSEPTPTPTSSGEPTQPVSTSEEPIVPDVSYDVLPTSYTDVLPESTGDGEILHCFNWTFNRIKKNIPYIAEAGFKAVQTSPVQQPKSNGSAWWAFYQPLSFSIADNSPLGTKDELQDMCDEAEKYGVSVICDIVFNHLANIGDGVLESDKTPVVNPDVAKYEPEIYSHRNDKENPTFHHNLSATGSGAETQKYEYGDLPDLNTGNELVQERSYALLKECIDVGVDGFRFDAAKHIETPDDPDYASDFWPNTLGKAKTYYLEKTGKELFAVGEVLGDPKFRSIDCYTKMMKITDDGFCTPVLNALRKSDASLLENIKRKVTDVNKLVSWVESHDTYASAAESGSSQVPAKRVLKAWSIIASRKGGNSLYFARPDDALTVGTIGSYEFENPIIGAINRFHNRFVDAEELIKIENRIYTIQRYSETDVGAVIVNCENMTGEYEISLKKFPDGLYHERLTGAEVEVKDGKCKVNLDGNGVAVLTKEQSDLRPIIKVSQRDSSFANSLDITVTVSNATEAYYIVNGGERVSFASKATITLAETSTVQFFASNNTYSEEREYTYTKFDLIEGYFNVVNLNPSLFDNYDVYFWSWGGKYNKGTWNQDYELANGNTVMLVDVDGIEGFLIALFEKGIIIADVNKWNDNVIRQSSDIKGATLTSGFYDAGNL